MPGMDGITVCTAEFRTGGSSGGEKTVQPGSPDHTPEGKIRYVHTEAQVIDDKNGSPARVTGTVRDITEPESRPQVGCRIS